ncbi:hypothetical protein LNTAR_06894 [Lentisphaera araneosa HTCC2155]|jgi:hypothetical protein|uniref:Uncharacterized protein n=1 Tax=Lentisphaera araneosa HTCC2155 TaxID=313628 RepID=A6DMR4_9BACT|nr:hypothetical protein [Lentisphaera araneosa]EDM26950.1 hypothetical protein LNTAR_06894 [Lentisphaera araneosa HTCC2155]
MNEENIEPDSDNKLLFILRLSAFLCLFGWAWQHLLWKAPYSALIGQEGAFLHLADNQIALLTRLIGVAFLVMSGLCWTVKKENSGQIMTLAVAGLLLIFMFFCRFVQVNYALPNFIEHGGQMLSPLLLILALKFGVRNRAVLASVILAFCMTFIGHGIYASGLYTTPLHFYALVEGSLALTGQPADIMIKTAGYLDFIICAALFCKPLRGYCMAYAVFWGAATALARPVAGMSLSLAFLGADQFLQQAIWRAPHALIPLFLFYYFAKSTESKSEEVFVEQGLKVQKDF